MGDRPRKRDRERERLLVSWQGHTNGSRNILKLGFGVKRCQQWMDKDVREVCILTCLERLYQRGHCLRFCAYRSIKQHHDRSRLCPFECLDGIDGRLPVALT